MSTSIIECLEVCKHCKQLISTNDDYTSTEDGFACSKCVAVAPVEEDGTFFRVVTIAIVLGVFSGLFLKPQVSIEASANQSQGVCK